IALFYAQSCYLITLDEKDFDESSYKDWMRVVRNITWQFQLSVSQLISVILLIQELAEGCLDIHYFLINNEIESRFASEQVAEEVRKAQLVVANETLKEILFALEDTNFCRGT